MTHLDWIVIGAYFLGVIAFGVVQYTRQRSLWDYYLAGRRTPWWQSGMSTMATQLGAISFVSAPAFVALKTDGGLKWLCYEFGVPIGILVVVIWIIPKLHRGNYISIYEYLEERFDADTRSLVSLLFQVGRALATAVSVLAGGLILSTATPLSTNAAILIIGAVTILYDALGGMRVVLVSDVVQMVIVMIGIVICGGTALHLVGWSGAISAFDPERLRVIDFSQWGFTGNEDYGFWPMTIGGIFLYASYYGCDQSQVQRELSVGSLPEVKKSLYLNAFGRFPVVFLYCLMGVFIGAVFAAPEHVAQIAARLGMPAGGVSEVLRNDPDRMVPMFILAFLPAGVVGFVFVAILSALMSSLDSAINSLSAVTMEDFYRRYVRPAADDDHYMAVSKILTVFWGVFVIAAALSFANVGEAGRQTTIVLINAVGSLLYGPILAAFLVGIGLRLITGIEIKFGVVVGIVANIALWRLTDVSWLWWNAAGFAVTVAGTLAAHVVLVAVGRGIRGPVVRPDFGAVDRLRPSHVSLVAYTALIVFVAYIVQQMG